MRLWPARRAAPALAGLLLAALLLLLGGCATPQVASLERSWPADLPAQVELKDVPFFAQEDYQCGPAALAMAAQAAGVALTPEALVPQVYLPGRQGSLQADLLAATRRAGLLAYPLQPTVDALLREVAAGRPVIVLQNLAFNFAPVWHYAVVIGFDRDRNQLVLHSGRTERMEMSLFTFERTWARGGYWALLVLPPAQLPATAQSQPHAQAAAALERVDPRAAQAAYASALQRWPDSRPALLGAGNAAYQQGQLDAAVRAYRHAVAVHADFAEAWNNLAQALLDQGRRREAGAAIDRAVALGGERLPQYAELRARIRGSLAGSHR